MLNNLSNIYIFTLISIIVIFTHFIVIKISAKLNLKVKPGARKIHKKPTPFTGGLTLIISFLLLTKLFELNYNIEIIILYSILIFFCGFIDDIFELNPGPKLLLMISPIVMLVFYENIYLTNLGEYKILGTVSLGKADKLFTILCVLLLINSINYVDGIDGLALSQVIFALAYFLFLSKNPEIQKHLTYLILIYTIILTFNISTGSFKTFIGDGGSLMSGFILSFITITLFKDFNIQPSKLIWALVYPVFDFLSVNILRIKHKRNIFSPGVDHFHHIILRLNNNNHIRCLICISLFSIASLFLGYIINLNFGNLFSIISFFIYFLLYFFIKNKIRNKFNV